MRIPFKRIIVFSLLSYCFGFQATAQMQTDSAVIKKLYNEALSSRKSYEQLEKLSNTIGGRLSGSPQAAKAVSWAKAEMEKMGLDRVYLQEVMVPHWVRGEKEEAAILPAKGKKMAVPVCALGGSVGTGKNGITAQVIEVKSLEEVEKLGADKISGKIVFYNRPMDPTHISTFEAYSGAVDQRGRGAIAAAKMGAVGVIVRSMNLALDDFPHTGAMRYDPKVKNIPAAAISTNGAEKLSAALKTDPNLKFFLKQQCETLPDVQSFNVIGEIKGSEKPEEIIVVGGHLDSWDLADGSQDDGAGCVQSMEVLRLFKTLGIKPKRTVRAVMFMNEENGVRGGKKYAEVAKMNKEVHLAAIESDAGGFSPRGFEIEGKPEQVKKIRNWKKLFVAYGLHEIEAGHSGTDIEPLEDGRVALIGLRPDSQRYFEIHHAATDTFEKVSQRELALGAASMAAMVYLLATYGL